MAAEAERSPAAARRPRGRPRSVACHEAILGAACDLLEEHRYAEVTMEKIAIRAGVAKQTLYKWWPSKAKLVMEAYAARMGTRIPLPDTGDIALDLETLLIDTCRALSLGNFGATLVGLFADAQKDKELQGELRDGFAALRQRRAVKIVERGVARGELRADVDTTLLLDLLYGPIWHRLLLLHAPLDDAFVGSLVAHVLSGARATPGGTP